MQKYVSNGLLALSAAFAFASCSKMDDSFKQFVVPGGITYVGKADSARVLPGRGRLMITWLRGTDPNTTEAVIYWNNKNDSLVVPVPAGNKTDSVKALITLPENTYSFHIFTRDKVNNRSIQVDVLGSSYGAAYEAGLLSRAISAIQPKAASRVIRFGAADATCIGTEVNYTDASGAARKIYAPAGVDTVLLESVKIGTNVTYRSSFKPAVTAIDSFWAVMTTVPLNQAIGTTATGSSFAGASPASFVIDGDKTATSFWQPLTADRTDDKKVSMVIDLGTAIDFNAVDHFWKAGNTLISGFTISYSNNGTAWTQCYSKTAVPILEERATFPQVNARYVKVEWTLATDGNINIWEVEVYKK